MTDSVEARQQGTDDDLGTCDDGHRYRVFVNTDGRVVAHDPVSGVTKVHFVNRRTGSEDWVDFRRDDLQVISPEDASRAEMELVGVAPRLPSVDELVAREPEVVDRLQVVAGGRPAVSGPADGAEVGSEVRDRRPRDEDRRAQVERER